MSGSVGNYEGLLNSDLSALPSPTKVALAKTMGHSSADTMSSADLDAAILSFFAFNSAFPILPVPSKASADSTGDIDSITRFTFEVKNKMAQICIGVLDAWLEAIDKEDERRKEEERSFHNVTKEEEKRAQRLGLSHGLNGYLNEIRTEAALPTQELTFVASAFIIGSHYIGPSSGIVDVASTEKFTVNAQANFMDANIWSRLQETIPTDTAFIANIFVTAVATSVGVEGVLKGKEAQDPKAKAESFARQVLSLINSSGFVSILMNAQVHKTENGIPLTNERKEQNLNMIRAVLLSTALTALYMAKYGGMKGAEFLALVDNNHTFEVGSTGAQVAEQLKAYLGTLPADKQADLKNAFVAFIDSGPADPTKKFAQLFDVGNVLEQMHLNTPDLYV